MKALVETLSRLVERLAAAQTAHPWRSIVLALALSAVGGGLAAGLKFDSSYYALMPEGAPEVENADRVRERTGGTRQLVIAIEGDDAAARLDFGRRLVERVEKIEQIRYADVEFPFDFVQDRGLWLMSPETLDRLVPAVEEAVRIAKVQNNPLALHLDEEAEKQELEAAWKKVDNIVRGDAGDLPFSRVLESGDGRFTFMLLIPSIRVMDLSGGQAMFAALEREIAALDPGAAGIQVRFAGTIRVFYEQHQTMRADLRNASVLALAFGIIVVVSFTRRPSSPFIVGSGLLSGVAWTFGLARVMVGQLNVITGFLVAVLIGLGIDFSIHILVRYEQERRREGRSPTRAAAMAFVGTLPPALTSALTTSGAFFSFTVAEFRGFSEFGLIAGVGVILTMISAFMVVPPLLMLMDRRPSADAIGIARGDITSGPVRGRLWRLAAVLVVLVWAAYGLAHVRDVPFHNNFRELRGTSPASDFFEYVDENLGFGFNPAVVITGDLDAAAEVKRAAHRVRDNRLATGAGSKIDQVFSLADLMPQQPEERRPRIERLRRLLDDPRLDRVEEKGDERAAQLARARRMVHTEPWELEDIPIELRRRLTTLDGKGLLTFVWPSEQNDADYQAVAWEDEMVELSAELHERSVDHRLADETLMAAWIYRLIVADGPRLLPLAAVVVLIIVAVYLRRPGRILVGTVPLAVGMLGFIAVVHAAGMEINMFNLIVIPSVIGIGIDNVLHIYHRYLHEGPGSAGFVLRSTGKAALLASLTTGVGFGSSLISHHLGLRSLGLLAVIGIGFTLFTATVFFPLLLTLLEHRGDRGAR